MKLFSVVAFSIFFTVQAFSQSVGIGTTAPANRLHVVNTADPLRLDGVSSGAVTDSILTINSTGVVKRRSVANVFNNGTGWLLAGNTGSTTTFLGTTNAAPLLFRTNSQKAGFIDYDTTKRNNSIGYRAQNAITTGTGNNAFGFQSLSLLNTGINNVAVGDSAGYSITTGTDNIVLGSDAGITLGIGSRNIALGTRSLATSSGSNDNISIGDHALENSDAASNIAIGTLALNKSVSTYNNLAIGYNALGLSPGASNGNNTSNIAIGNGALSNTITSTDQLAVGYNVGYGLTTGSYNTLIGHFAFSGNFGSTASNYNTVLGYQAGANQTSGSNNTYLGYLSGNTQTAGSNNTYIGYQAGPTVTGASANYSNSAALGMGTVVGLSNAVYLGNNSITRIYASVTSITSTSDERVKTNVQEDVKGLAFISLLRPVTYNYDVQKMNDLQKVPLAARTSYTEKQSIRYSGFLAQEVEAAAQKTGYDFSGISKPKEGQVLYGINYTEMVVPLVKAIQELKEMVEKQQAEIEALKKQISTNR